MAGRDGPGPFSARNGSTLLRGSEWPLPSDPLAPDWRTWMETKRGEPVPNDLAAALTAEPPMLAMWQKMRPSCQAEYVKYVSEAKKPETRARRIAYVLRQVAEWHARRAPAP